MTGPRDPVTRFAVPVNYETGEELTDRQQLHLAELNQAVEALYRVMHEAEGSAPPEHLYPGYEHQFQSRRMAIAGTHIETALMFARRAALEAR